MDLKKYIYGHCIHPVRVRVWDSFSQSYVVRELPCGKCLHCRQTHINEWVTRLFAQRKYSKYCYYVSLDYAPFETSDPTALMLACETAACEHNINSNHRYGLHPLVLCKNHLQDFYKRLRKNTGIKLQYFACGEYGTHANGRGYGRPHFHNIIFSDVPIKNIDFINAWTVNGYVIGRVDIDDMNNICLTEKDNTKIFKYVCKYLQKADFDFEKLATIDYHRAYFKSLCVVKGAGDLFFPDVPIENSGEIKQLWCDYIKQYSPFALCSRRPAIGAAYLADNLERFKVQDFRLFGLPSECSVFPRYYLRATKEALCTFKALGKKTFTPSSSSRLGYIETLLRKLLAYRTSLDCCREEFAHFGRVYRPTKEKLCVNLDGYPIECASLNFYDAKNKFMYQFDGYKYRVWAKMKYGYTLLYIQDISDVLSELSPSFGWYYQKYVAPMHYRQVLTEQDLINSIDCFYGGSTYEDKYKQFKEEVFARYNVELDTLRKTKLLMSNSKNVF